MNIERTNQKLSLEDRRYRSLVSRIELYYLSGNHRAAELSFSKLPEPRTDFQEELKDYIFETISSRGQPK